MVNITKLYPTQDASVFHSFGRVLSGTCKFLLFVLFLLKIIEASETRIYFCLNYIKFFFQIN